MSELFSLYHEIYYYRCSDKRRDGVQRYDVAVGGSVHTRLHASATMAPEMMEQGIRLDVESVRMKRRVIWGTARPMKATGPQYAVVTAVCIPVIRSNMARTR